jgi:hypothetical protein
MGGEAAISKKVKGKTWYLVIRFHIDLAIKNKASPLHESGIWTKGIDRERGEVSCEREGLV